MKNVPGWNYIATKDVGFDGTVTYKNGVIIPFSEAGFRIAPAGSVFVCSEGGSAGKKTAIINEDVCFGNKLFAIVNDRGLFNEKYLFFYTRYEKFREQFRLLATTLMGGISSKNFATIEIPLADLSKQERIVARIEELFSQLDAGVETLKKTKAQLATYRQAVLKEAFEGSYIRDLLEKSESKHRVMHIRDFAKVDTGATPLKTNKAFYGGSVAWVTSGKINEETIHSPTDYITDLALKETNCKVFPPGTLLVAMYGEGKTRGKCAELMIPAATNQALAAITLNEESPVIKTYLKWFLTKNYQQIRRRASGGVQPNLSLSVIKAISVNVFPKSMQEEIVKQIEARWSICDSIERTIDAALLQAEAMWQSILKDAFEGRL